MCEVGVLPTRCCVGYRKFHLHLTAAVLLVLRDNRMRVEKERKREKQSTQLTLIILNALESKCNAMFLLNADSTLPTVWRDDICRSRDERIIEPERLTENEQKRE